jgi:hypothetical protein
MTETDPLALHLRDGLPDELLTLSKRHPREGWARSAGMSGSAGVWLERHGFFRALSEHLAAGLAAFGGGRDDVRAYLGRFQREMGALLSQLDGHHRIEDGHYFPMFSQAAPEMKRGFEILDADHHAIHGGLHDLAGQSRGLLTAAQAGKADRDIRDLGARLGETLADFRPLLVRHLDDEEDIVIPLIIERGRTDPRFA